MSVLRRVVSVLVVLASSGCGRLFFDPPTPRGDASGLDAAVTLDAAASVPEDGAVDGATDDGSLDASMPPDAAEDAWSPPCGESPCQLVAPQCGCAAGLACQRPFGDDPTRQCIAPGARLPGETCMLNAECTTGYACVAGGGTVGMCEPFCRASADCAPDTFCRELIVTSEDIGTCATRCDPVANTGCPPSLGCMVSTTRDVPARSFVTWSFCANAGAALGAPCPSFVCEGGAACVDDICRRVCDVATPSCPTGSCRSFVPATVIGGRELGYCL